METRIALAALAAGSLAAAPAAAQLTTPASQEVLRALKLQPAVLKGLEQELAVPPEWVTLARKEGKVGVTMTMEEQHFEKVRKVFNARYPGIEIEYGRGIGQRRALSPLLAWRRGNFITDVVSSFQVLEGEYRASDSLENVVELLPAAKSVRDEYKSVHGIGVAYRLTNYCIAYATERVKKAELPKTWEELLVNPRWRNGRTGMAANANAWLAQLWGYKGEKWGQDYMRRIFSDLRPQLRKENLPTIGRLAALGEYDIAIPSADSSTQDNVREGIKLGYHCPDVVPVSVLWVGVLKKSPRRHAALLFSNWLLSREGQLTINWADYMTPSNRHLEMKELLFYPDEVLGKPRAAATAAVFEQMPKIMETWTAHWNRAGGAPIADEGGGKGGKKGPR
jgi:iron(III) transport system substrate-binding protein